MYYSRTLADEALYFPIIRVLAKNIRLKKLKSVKAQCIPFGLYIKDLKGICAQIGASVCARVITNKRLLNCPAPAPALARNLPFPPPICNTATV